MRMPISYSIYMGTAMKLCETASGGVTKAATMKMPSSTKPRFLVNVVIFTKPVQTNNTVAIGTSKAKPNASSKIITKSK